MVCFFSSPAKLFSLEIMGTEVLGSEMPLFPDPRSSRFRSDECGIIKPRPQGQWSEGLAALSLFQSYRPPPSLDQQLPSKASGEESIWSQHHSPPKPSSFPEPEFRAHRGQIHSHWGHEPADEDALDFLQRKMLRCHFQFHLGFWESQNAWSPGKTWNKMEMGSAPLSVLTANPLWINSSITPDVFRL